jgi:hypothetical protein
MKSPGHPGWRREVEREFWREVRKGLIPREAAEVVGVSQAVGSRWFRHGGGMPSVELTPLSGRYLSFAEREESKRDLITPGDDTASHESRSRSEEVGVSGLRIVGTVGPHADRQVVGQGKLRGHASP